MERPFLFLGRTRDIRFIFSRSLTFVILEEFGSLRCGFGVVDGSVVFPCFPQLVTVRLVLEHKHIHRNLHHVLTA